jgi:signal transduction histidine kinase
VGHRFPLKSEDLMDHSDPVLPDNVYPLQLVSDLFRPGSARAEDVERLGQAEAALVNVALENERRRIARALHDDVIQSLFAVTLGLGSASRSLSDPRDRANVERCSDIVTRVIADIRNHISGSLEIGPSATPLSTLVDEVVQDFELETGPHITVCCGDHVDDLTDRQLLDDACSVVREGLSNAVRHSFASRIDIWVEHRDGMLTVEIADDGVGLNASTRSSGAANLRQRAEMRGGWFRLSNAPTGGCTMVWCVPARRSADLNQIPDSRSGD